jgi:hypothetical protein
MEQVPGLVPPEHLRLAGVVNKYLVFHGDWYYPTGGWLDFATAFETFEEAHAWATEHTSAHTWTHVVCDSRIIARYERAGEQSTGPGPLEFRDLRQQ